MGPNAQMYLIDEAHAEMQKLIGNLILYVNDYNPFLVRNIFIVRISGTNVILAIHMTTNGGGSKF